MAYNNLYQQYQQNSITTASPEELTLMLYNGAIKFINLGKLHIESKEIEKANNAIKRAQDIIYELNNTLDMSYPVSSNLRSIYTFIIERLVDANIKKDVKILDEILPLIEGIRDTWKEAMREARKIKYGAL
ncbi:flagellar export chaperone FliS [Proteiniborus sp. MB09-C3]|uniref:flagellar export chaperone FliS n=1 Tax=Proteiniborus sp. MB09-C3 TaxID=3050072 RepID=UPI002555C5B2|nr:flagellar export chaperone FliS [Proteiniborus sp. MB09-C3]WIV12017.1 flagellar export chaperone FliS [Proteiniborus sp. MB09-C3]